VAESYDTGLSATFVPLIVAFSSALAVPVAGFVEPVPKFTCACTPTEHVGWFVEASLKNDEPEHALSGHTA
jgi:hypothetical protein